MKKSYIFKGLLLTFSILLLGSFSRVMAQNYFYVGTATTASSSADNPFYTYYHDKRSSYLILASELQALGATGDILSLAIDVASPAAQAMNGFNIKLAQTTATTMTGFVGTTTNVYSATAHTATSGWNNFTFSAPFNWDGVSNVVVEICFDNSSYTSSSSVRYTATSFQSTYGQYSDSWAGPGCTMTTGSTLWSGTTYRPNMRFEFTPPFANDASVNALINPTFPTCAMDSAVSVRLFNSGTAALTSANVNWSVNGVLQATNSWTGNLAAFASDTVSLGTVAGGLSDGDVIVAWSTMPNAVPDSNNLNDTMSVTVYNSLAGTYVIDPTFPAGTGDFASFTDAVAAMDDYGICGPTVFEVVDSTYIEQIELMNFTGMSDTNTVTFRSQSGNRDNVVLTYTSANTGDNYVVKMMDADNYTFEDMTIWAQGTSYAWGFHLWGADNFTMNNCVIKSYDQGYAYNSRGMNAYYYNNGAYASCHDFTVTNCTFSGGYYNMYFYNDFNDKATDVVIENNEFTNAYYYGAYCYNAEDIQLNNNYATSNTTNTYGYAFYIGSVTNGSISSNFVDGSMTWPRVGLYLNNCQGDLSTFMPITNNRVYLPHLSADYGIYSYNGLFTEFAHNSVAMEGDNFGRGFYFSSGSYNKVKNNNIQVTGGGQAFYLNGSGIYEMDYNNLSSPNGNIGYAGSNQATLMDWQNATGFDANSVTVNDVYADSTTLKVCTDSLFGMGVSLPMYAYDFEGDMRQNPPCIGADEFMPISMFGFNTNPVLCDGDTLTLVQDYYDTVVWNTTDTTKTYAIYAPGSQTVAVYDGCGSDTSNFVVDAQVLAFIGDTNLCEGTTATLSTGLTAATSYAWITGGSNPGAQSTATVVVSEAQTVTVEVVDMHGCYSADTATVTQSYDVVLPDSTTFCEGGSVVLDANMTGTYAWSDGSTNQTLAASVAGTYSVTVTDQNCISNDASIVTEILDVVPSYTDSSDNMTVVFTNTTQNATSYLWDFGDGTTSTVEHPIHVYPWTPLDSITYTVTLTAYNSCGDLTFVNDGVRVGQLVSVSEITLASMVSVYPNPNTGVFNVSVKTEEALDMQVEVMDVRGALVYTNSFGKVNGEVNRTISIENAASGIYFVKVTLDGETAVYRMSVK